MQLVKYFWGRNLNDGGTVGRADVDQPQAVLSTNPDATLLPSSNDVVASSTNPDATRYPSTNPDVIAGRGTCMTVAPSGVRT